MSDLASINIGYAVACDDIRQEANGKFILIGVYAGNLALHSLPAQIALGFWMMAKPSKKGDYHIQFRVQVPGGTEFAFKGEVIAHILEEEETALALPPLPIPLASVGDLTLQYREGGGPWHTVCTVKVKLLLPAPS